MNIQETIREFLLENTEFTVFRALYDADPAIENYLQSIIDEISDYRRVPSCCSPNR